MTYITYKKHFARRCNAFGVGNHHQNHYLQNDLHYLQNDLQSKNADKCKTMLYTTKKLCDNSLAYKKRRKKG